MTNTRNYKRLRLILGDQLNASHSWFKQLDNDTLYLIAELHQEATYTTHHLQKIVAFFASMQNFADALIKKGFEVSHLTLDDTACYNDLPQLLTAICEQHDIDVFEYQLPDEYRLSEQLALFCAKSRLVTRAYETEHFYLSDGELKNYFEKGKSHRLESFYRKLRVKFDVLMNDGKPEGGQWNFDANNRKKLKKTDLPEIPAPLVFANNIDDVLQRIERHNITTMGECDPNLLWPTNRQQALDLLDYFCKICLPKFGQFQDAMTGKLNTFDQDNGWSLYHSRLSFALNCKMISPSLVADTAVRHYKNSSGSVGIDQIEGFVRQILGWREFVRGIYWANMPQYGQLNHLAADRQLPNWFWTADTKMNCQHHAIKQSLRYAYAHHIQRLMVTGNFCLLTGIRPDEVDEWYLGIYIDAIEWVEMPNTRGMSQFADGGIVGSKPYAASGNYINKMSDYCGDCSYNVKQTVGQNACPLNSLYWRFMHTHHKTIRSNPRTTMVYNNWLKRDEQEREAVLAQAENYLTDIEHL